jgi:hypothetical protein
VRGFDKRCGAQPILILSEVEGLVIELRRQSYFASIGKNLFSHVRMISITRGFSWLNMK